MPIPSEIRTLIERLYQELNQIEQQAAEGMNLLRPVLFIFPDNAILMQFFASLNNVIFAAQIYRRRIQTTVDTVSAEDVQPSEIQEAGEELGTILGLVMEAKIRVTTILTSLQDLP